MAVRPIVLYPDPLLARVSEPVGQFDPTLAALVADMFDTMYAAPGRGLAAVQVGVLSRLFVMDATWKDGARSPQVFVNPVVADQSQERVTREEACLSIPDTPRRVARPAEVTLRWQDVHGEPHQGTFTGFEAACIQHEFDHLDGRLILDHPEAP